MIFGVQRFPLVDFGSSRPMNNGIEEIITPFTFLTNQIKLEKKTHLQKDRLQTTHKNAIFLHLRDNALKLYFGIATQIGKCINISHKLFTFAIYLI